MKSSTAMILFFLGLILTMFGVGGVENSLTDTELLQALAVSVVGLGIAGAGVLAQRVSDSYDQ
jgi:hypothetical protein